jgi:N-acetylneuraminic acid mutarotase
MTSDGADTLYLHAGCPETGRLSDLWAFRLSTREWTRLASAPDPPRGGTSIAFADGALYRMNGFDGKSEQGGSVDVYSPETNTWWSYAFVADGVSGPEARSVSALLPVRIGCRVALVTLFGERDPSALGHQGAGKMLGDVWVFGVEERSWMRVDVQGEAPRARGWFAADVLGENAIVVQGGLDESNGRLGDVWILSF